MCLTLVDWRMMFSSTADCLHSVPVAQMGNYQEYLKMMPSPLREIDPDQPKRLHTFGNPFKQDKKVGKAAFSALDMIFRAVMWLAS